MKSFSFLVLLCLQEALAFAPSASTTRLSSSSALNKRQSFLFSTAEDAKAEVVDAVDTSVSQPDTYNALANNNVLELEEDKKAFHIGALSLSTLWWYVYTSIDFFTHPTSELFVNIPSWAVNGLACYTTISQLIVYGCMWQLTNAKTLRGAQLWTVVCILLCVPADVSVVLFDPTGSAFLTVMAFAGVTMFFAIFFVHYVRLAAVREDRSMKSVVGVEQVLATVEPAVDDGSTSLGHHHHVNPDGPFGELRDYRPPRDIQSFNMAVQFTRSFVAFTLAMAGFRGAFFGAEAGNILVIASCALVAFHTAIEMILTTVFPGSDLEEYKSFNMVETSVYFLHIICASVIGHEEAFGETIWDELLYSWLFGNATAQFFASVNHLIGGFDFDSSLGLKKSSSKEAAAS